MVTQERDQLFCFLDVLGFSNLVKQTGLDALYEKYQKLISAADQEQVDSAFFSSRSGRPYFGYQKIEATYFSDTIIFWCPYDIHHLEVLANCIKEVICRSIELGLPLRGAISVGKAKLNTEEKVFIGKPVVNAVEAEKVQRWIGVTLANSFRAEPYNSGFKADCFLHYEKHLKSGGLSEVTPLVIDWPRKWRATREQSLIDAIKQLNTEPEFEKYYTNTIDFVSFSGKNERWWEQHTQEST